MPDIGDRRKLTIEIRDESNALADPDALTFEMTTPDGNTVTYVMGTDAELVRDSLGVFHVYWDCALNGVHRYRWAATGSIMVADTGAFLVGVSEDLTAFDVEQYTSGRMSADDDETQRALDAALAKVRNHCHWHVSPVRSQTVTLRGDGWPDVQLPTLNIVSIESITENGEPVDLDDVTLYRDTLTKVYGTWCGVIVVEFTHGYNADEAPDWRDVVLQLASKSQYDTGSGAVVFEQVDDIQTRWAGGSFEDLYGSTLAPYRRQWWAV